MKLISWNVNGLRAAVKHDFVSTFNNLNADFFCIQETKLQAGQIKLDLPGYHQFWNYAQKKKDIQAPLFLLSKNPLMLLMAWILKTMTLKDELLR